MAAPAIHGGAMPAPYAAHPLAAIFPAMTDAEFESLKSDIKANGLHEPIWLHDGKVLDGRHRQAACLEVGVEPRYLHYEGGDPVAFVLSLNLERRHLTEAQRAMVAAKLATLPRGANQHAQFCAPTQQEAADALQVSRRSVQTAAKVQHEAPPEVAEAVAAGALSLNLAAQVAELPPEEQAAVAAAPQEQMKAAAREAVHNHRAEGTGENEWQTPAEYLDAVREVLGTIELDPASSQAAQQVTQGAHLYTADNHSLKREWRGRFFARGHAGQVTECIIVTHSYTQARWFQAAGACASAVCFPRRRTNSVAPNGKKANPTEGQAFFYFGKAPQKFISVFGKFGLVMVRADVMDGGSASAAAHGAGDDAEADCYPDDF